MQYAIDWLNNNPGIVAIGIFVGGTILTILGFFIKKWLFSKRASKILIQKQRSGDGSTNLQAGRDINIRK